MESPYYETVYSDMFRRVPGNIHSGFLWHGHRRRVRAVQCAGGACPNSDRMGYRRDAGHICDASPLLRPPKPGRIPGNGIGRQDAAVFIAALLVKSIPVTCECESCGPSPSSSGITSEAG